MSFAKSESADGLKPDSELSVIMVSLLKGVIYQEDNQGLWGLLLKHRARASDYAAVLGLLLMVDEAEGYAYLQSIPDDEETGTAGVPRLVVRRQLSYTVSLMLALLRKKLAEFDASGSDSRLILSREEATDLMRIFLPEISNEARLSDQADATLNKIAELGFVRRLRGQNNMIEVRRIIKAYVDAQWLGEFDARLEEYRALSPSRSEANND